MGIEMKVELLQEFSLSPVLCNVDVLAEKVNGSGTMMHGVC